MASKILDLKTAKSKTSELSEKFFIIKNPDFIYPPYELYPLPPAPKLPLKKISGIVMDMDGTTTTTEVLCIHSLEYMVRVITGNMGQRHWDGLNPVQDYPNIIGNSTTRHVEFLLNQYGGTIMPAALCENYLYASAWTLLHSHDANRSREVQGNLELIGCSEMLIEINRIRNGKVKITESLIESLRRKYSRKYSKLFINIGSNLLVRLAIDIYYQRYHFILSRIKTGDTSKLLKVLPPELHKKFIEPMEGIGEFLALTTGLLGTEAGKLAERMIEKLHIKHPDTKIKISKEGASATLTKLGKYFEKNPVKVGVVTSSIFYEADIVLSEVFRCLKEEIKEWGLSPAGKKKVLSAFSSYEKFYNAVVTASDSHEIRLKPHRDLYSIALYKLGIPRDEFQSVIGFEDSESGNIAIKAAGIGLALAVPFAQTAHHNLEAADFILEGGIPETILKHKLFLKI